jgi:RND family efflux transporter MFP subunit
MGNLFKKAINFIKSHKVAIGVGFVILIVALITGLPRVRAYLAGPVAKFETAKVKKEDITSSISASGQIEAERQVTLKFQASGKLVWVGVKEGEMVNKWQAIASLDVREVEKNIRKKLLAYMSERWDFEQSMEDYGVEGVPIEKVGVLTEAERRILEKAQFDLDSAVADVEIQDLAKKLATIHSPIEGIVTNIEAPIAGVNITPATAEFIIADPTEMKFVANVDESDIGQIQSGQKVEIALDAYLDELFESEVGKVSFSAITTRGGGTAFPVDISLPENIEEKYKVGMNGDVEIIISQVEEVLSVPTEAIIEKKGEKFVRVIEGKTIKEMVVETGVESEIKVQILSGLAEGQVIITGEKKK